MAKDSSPSSRQRVGPVGIGSRTAAATALAHTERCDALIVGGGINGAATFWDLAHQGLSCVLVDAEDFGAGASSASTRMAHGGLRYLETGQLRLVVEATRERDRLLVNASHAVEPLEVTIPLFSMAGGLWGSFGKLFGRQTRLPQRGLLLVELGLILYDMLGRRSRALPGHQLRFAAKARQRFAGLHPAVRGTASYFDGRISHAERIAFELVGDGMKAATAPCVALNHCALQSCQDGRVMLRDTLNEQAFVLRPRIIVNAGGAWIDEINARLGAPSSIIDGTKGSHLVVEHLVLFQALSGSAFSWDDGRGRMCVMYPLGDRVLLGSTDIRIGHPDAAVCDPEETAYLLAAVRLIFPWVDLHESHIRFAFCGVRPLPRSQQKDTVNISRDHSISIEPAMDGRPPILSLVGGKWTTFRAFAEQATDRVLALVEDRRRMSTATLAIGGGGGLPRDPAGRTALIDEIANSTSIGRERVATLVGRYGMRAAAIASHCALGLDEILADAPDYSRREIDWIVRQEMAVTLADVLLRRTVLGVSGRLTGPLIRQVSSIIAAALSRGEVDARRELDRFVSLLAKRHGLNIDLESATEVDHARAVA